MLEIKRKVYDGKDWYEKYIQVLKDGKEIHYSESFELPKYKNGKVWEAFFKKDKKIYLNTELSVSFEINEIL